MAELLPEIRRTKAGVQILLRSSITDDAEAVKFIAESVLQETIFHLSAPGELQLTLEKVSERIDACRRHPSNYLLIAFQDNKPIGTIEFTGGHRQRIAHTGELGMSLLEGFRNQGIGSVMLEALIDAVRASGRIEKMCLSVLGDNERAIALYKKSGFMIEGVRRNHIKFEDGRRADIIEMGLLL